MAENPLLPHAELRALHAVLRALVRARPPRRNTVSGRQPAPATAPDRGPTAALLAATVLQLRAGDIAVGATDLGLATALAATSAAGRENAAGVLRLDLPFADPGLPYAAALADAQKQGGTGGLVLSFATPGTPAPLWREVLRRAQAEQLPLVLVCPDPGELSAFQRDDGTTASTPDTLSWGAVLKHTTRLQLPILSVDGTDAVAVYRVMQESALRARGGGGPALLWAALPHTAPATGADAPLPRLERYLKVRKVTTGGSRA